jgi:hypothetical protein
MVAAYCPVVAANGAPTYRKYAELRRFSLDVAAAVSPQAAAAPFPPVDVVWATPAGRSFVARLPGAFAGKITCPANDGTLVPTDLVAKASAALDKLKLPVGGVATVTLATRLATQTRRRREPGKRADRRLLPGRRSRCVGRSGPAVLMVGGIRRASYPDAPATNHGRNRRAGRANSGRAAERRG